MFLKSNFIDFLQTKLQGTGRSGEILRNSLKKEGHLQTHDRTQLVIKWLIASVSQISENLG